MAKTTVNVKGINKVIKNLNREIKNIEGDTLAGMQRGGLMLERKAKQITPVDTGTLRNSGFSQTVKTPSGPVTRVGFTAKYAPYVHEMARTLSGTPRFLFVAVSQNARRFVQIVAKAARVK